MTVREKLKQIICDNGMFAQQAQKIMDISVPIIDEFSDDYEIQWENDSEFYSDEMYDFLFSMVKPEVLKWIDEHIPSVWSRENFVD